ncbi:hypothetical protein ZEAMMB73_Zm00001d004412 [Zea mays]|nr:hypothetical protein ZEAMMB73_Zm00001d004412 [Zea mays]
MAAAVLPPLVGPKRREGRSSWRADFYSGGKVMLMCKHLHLEFCLARMNQVYFPILLHLR